MAFDMKAVQSSHVAAYGYDSAEQVMRVQFKDGRSYDYHGVTPTIAKAMEDAPSKGKYVRIIANGCPSCVVKE